MQITSLTTQHWVRVDTYLCCCRSCTCPCSGWLLLLRLRWLRWLRLCHRLPCWSNCKPVHWWVGHWWGISIHDPTENEQERRNKKENGHTKNHQSIPTHSSLISFSKEGGVQETHRASAMQTTRERRDQLSGFLINNRVLPLGLCRLSRCKHSCPSHNWTEMSDDEGSAVPIRRPAPGTCLVCGEFCVPGIQTQLAVHRLVGFCLLLGGRVCVCVD